MAKKKTFDEDSDISGKDEYMDHEGEDKEDHELEMDMGDAEADPYTEAGRDVLEEGGEEEAWEQGFAEGDECARRNSVNGRCSKILAGHTHYVEKDARQYIEDPKKKGKVSKKPAKKVKASVKKVKKPVKKAKPVKKSKKK